MNISALVLLVAALVALYLAPRAPGPLASRAPASSVVPSINSQIR